MKSSVIGGDVHEFIRFDLTITTQDMDPYTVGADASAIVIFSSATSAIMELSCAYATSIGISSAPFVVKNARAAGARLKFGDFTSGFRYFLLNKFEKKVIQRILDWICIKTSK